MRTTGSPHTGSNVSSGEAALQGDGLRGQTSLAEVFYDDGRKDERAKELKQSDGRC